MNPRILKKLTKKAEPIIIALGLTKNCKRVVSGPSGGGEIEKTVCRVDRKHYRRLRSGKVSDYFYQLPGTVGYGETSGYYEPEWCESCCWSILKEHGFDSFTDWDSCTETSGWPENHCPRKLKRNPAAILKHARSLVQSCAT